MIRHRKIFDLVILLLLVWVDSRASSGRHALKGASVPSVLASHPELVIVDGSNLYVESAKIIVRKLRATKGFVCHINKILGPLVGNISLHLGSLPNASSVKEAMKLIDADFFNASKRQEMVEGALSLNIPSFQINQKIVASSDGGLHHPSALIFDPNLNGKQVPTSNEIFKHPMIHNIIRPTNDDDLAFMTVLELGALIKTKKVTSQELTKIFLQRLKRYYSPNDIKIA